MGEHDDDSVAEVSKHLDALDGSAAKQVMLLTGLSVAELVELGGFPGTEGHPDEG